MLKSRLITALLIPVAMAFLASRFASAQQTTNGDAMSGATFRSLTPPVYPPLARQAGITGDVIVKVSLRADGTVESVTPVSGHPMLVQAAVRSAEQSKFECVTCASGSTQSLTYSFELSPEKPEPDDCSENRPLSTPSDPVSTPSDIRILQSANHVTLIVARLRISPDACTVKWAEEHSHFRSPKCLYLWKCGHRKIAIL